MIKATELRIGKDICWQAAVSSYISFMEGHFSDRIELDGASARSLKNIYKELKSLAEEKRMYWTRDIATRSLLMFFNFAWNYSKVIRSVKWFLVYSNKYKTEILEQIKLYKNQKTKQ